MLLERDHVLDELDQLAARAVAREGRIVFIVGEAGIGKTSVLRAAALRLQQRMRCLWAACEDLTATEALTLLRDLTIVDPDALDRANEGGSRMTLFRDALARLSETPTVLFVEDLHWADDGSIDFLRYVGRRVADEPLLVIVSSRNEEQGARSRLVRAQDVPPATRSRFDLARLSSAAVGRLAAARGLIGSLIHDVTGGNPLFVSEMLDHGGVRPVSIDDLVLGRANQLDSAARGFLDYCSIIPRRVSFEQVSAAGVGDQSIQQCIDSGLLLPDGDGLAFRHEVTRRSVEDALTPLRRRQLHAFELERLDQTGASAARRLHHAMAASATARVRELAPHAAQQASMLGAHRDAARAWSNLFDRAAPAPDAGQCERYAFELHVIGDLSEAIYWLGVALDQYDAAGDVLRKGDCLRFLSRLHYLNGARTLADEAGAQAVALLEAFPGTAELALAHANLGHLAMLADSNGEAVRWSERAIELAERLGRDDILATALNNQGTALQHEDPARSLELLDRSLALGLASASHEHAARSHVNKAWMLMHTRRLDEAKAAFEAGIAFCSAHDLDTWRDYLTGGLALTSLNLGDWDAAEQIAGSVVAGNQTSHLVRNPAVRALALLRIRRGQEGVDAFVDEIRDHMTKGREAPRYCAFALVVAEQAWIDDRGQSQAHALLDHAREMLPADASPWDRAGLWFWQHLLGSAADAPACAPEPYLRLAAGDVAGAAALWAAMSMPFERALALVEGDEEQAGVGIALLDRLGAVATAARARATLAERGLRLGTRGPRASTRNNRFGLTRREVDVLGAIERGLTNKEIGAQLFVSAKTVDHHVSSILGKINARTRGEAAALARDHGLLD